VDRFHAMKVFARVVEESSFSGAADRLGMPRPTVSVIVKNLEAFLKVRLLQRTTRRVRLTHDGAAYYERCVRILADVDEMENMLSETERQHHGKVAVDMPSAIGRIIVMPRLREFRASYPDIDLMIRFEDRSLDLIRDGVDCAIQIGALKDSSLVARRIGTYRPVTVASPSYLSLHGVPKHLLDLEQHYAVNLIGAGTGQFAEMSFLVEGHEERVKLGTKVAVNNSEAYLASTLAGIGISQIPDFVAAPHIRTGVLIEVLPAVKSAVVAISTIYPHSRHLSPSVRLFVDWLASIWTQIPAPDPTIFMGERDLRLTEANI
jgi:LysR family transcriptional regulator, regulator for bpeEF and oprC